MSRADDIAKLFQRLGASTDAYLEMDSSFDYQETPVLPLRSVAAPEQSAREVPLAAPVKSVQMQGASAQCLKYAAPASALARPDALTVQVQAPTVHTLQLAALPELEQAPVANLALMLDEVLLDEEQGASLTPQASDAALGVARPPVILMAQERVRTPAISRTLHMPPPLQPATAPLAPSLEAAPATELDMAQIPALTRTLDLPAPVASRSLHAMHTIAAASLFSPSMSTLAPAPTPSVLAEPMPTSANQSAPVPPEVPVQVQAIPQAHVLPLTKAAPAAMPVPTSRPAPARSVPAPLRSLLAEVAKVRQDEAEARNNEALHQAMLKALPPSITARVIALVSGKGGVGKSTLCAALANTLALPGGRIVAVELDPQNSLRHHLQVSPDVAGLAQGSLRGDNWNDLLLAGPGTTQVLPYGVLSAGERRSLEQYLDQDPHWLARQIDRMQLNAHDVLVLDVASGPSRLLDQALDVATQVLVVLDTEVSSYMALDTVEQWLEPLAERRLAPVCNYVINRFDESRTFSCDMLEVLRRRLGERLVGRVRNDHAIAEALAYGTDPLAAEVPGEGVQDLLELGAWLKARLLAEGAKESRMP